MSYIFKFKKDRDDIRKYAAYRPRAARPCVQGCVVIVATSPYCILQEAYYLNVDTIDASKIRTFCYSLIIKFKREQELAKLKQLIP
jgi:hypothetical protein